MTTKVITDSSSEKLVVKWDGNTFGLVLLKKESDTVVLSSVIILNPREAIELVAFLGSMGKEE